MAWANLRRATKFVKGLPTEWSEIKNVVWKTPVSRGTTPTLVGDRIYLATAEEDEMYQSVIS